MKSKKTLLLNLLVSQDLPRKFCLKKAYGAIMLRSRLRNSFLKKYLKSKQRTTNNATFALKSLKQVKKEHFQKHLPIRNY